MWVFTLTAFIYWTIFFSDVTAVVLSSPTVSGIDSFVFHLFSSIADTKTLAPFFLAVTALGDFKTVILISFLFSIVLLIRRKQHLFLPFFFALIGSALFVYTGKEILQKARPNADLLIANGFSFPSGHTTLSVVLYGFIAFVILRYVSSRSARILAGAIGTLVVLLVGISRLYLGVHFLSDVFVGYLAGFLWLVLAIMLSENMARHNNHSPRLDTTT